MPESYFNKNPAGKAKSGNENMYFSGIIMALNYEFVWLACKSYIELRARSTETLSSKFSFALGKQNIYQQNIPTKNEQFRSFFNNNQLYENTSLNFGWSLRTS